MPLSYGFDGTRNEITHITLPNGQQLTEFKGFKVSGLDEFQFLVRSIERSYNAGVAAEGKRLSALINQSRYKS